MGGVNFATRSMFKSELLRRIQLDPRKITQHRKKCLEYNNVTKSGLSNEFDHLLFKILIVDLSAVNYIDPAGVEQLKLIQNEFEDLDIMLYFANASGIYLKIIMCQLKRII